jgi:hypothetical protein
MGILKKAAPAAETNNTPAFESEDGQETTAVVQEAAPVVKTVTRGDVAPAVVEEVKTEAGVVEAAAQSAATAAESSVEAAPVKSAVVLARTEGGQLKTFLNNGGGIVSPLKDLENAFAKAGIETDYSTFPRLRVDAGCIASTEGREAGDFIEIQVISFAPSWTITTGTDGEESKKWVRFSDDGKVTNAAGDNDEYAGTPLDEYKAILVSNGFEKASIKVYTIVTGIAVEAEEADFAHLNEVVSLSLAPQSAKKFDSYIINRTIQAKMNRLKETSGNPVVRFTSERTKGKDNQSFFNLIPSHGETAPADLS